MIRTKLTERYGIELPFVSAGMGFIATPPLAAAVSNAGFRTDANRGRRSI